MTAKAGFKHEVPSLASPTSVATPPDFSVPPKAEDEMPKSPLSSNPFMRRNSGYTSAEKEFKEMDASDIKAAILAAKQEAARRRLQSANNKVKAATKMMAAAGMRAGQGQGA